VKNLRLDKPGRFHKCLNVDERCIAHTSPMYLPIVAWWPVEECQPCLQECMMQLRRDCLLLLVGMVASLHCGGNENFQL
jgi:hypothetical protein